MGCACGCFSFRFPRDATRDAPLLPVLLFPHRLGHNLKYPLEAHLLLSSVASRLWPRHHKVPDPLGWHRRSACLFQQQQSLHSGDHGQLIVSVYSEPCSSAVGAHRTHICFHAFPAAKPLHVLAHIPRAFVSFSREHGGLLAVDREVDRIRPGVPWTFHARLLGSRVRVHSRGFEGSSSGFGLAFSCVATGLRTGTDIFGRSGDASSCHGPRQRSRPTTPARFRQHGMLARWTWPARTAARRTPPRITPRREHCMLLREPIYTFSCTHA